MADISITIPDGVLNRVLDGVAAYKDYDGNKLPGETKGQFGKRMIIQEVKKWVIAVESADAAATQGSTTDSEVDIT